MKTTLVLGASTNSSRYSYMAVNKLKNHGYDVIPFGIKKGSINGIKIINDKEELSGREIHTITLYLGPQNQFQYYSLIEKLNPKRVIFNPGTINPSFMKDLESKGIEVVEACTLVMLSASTY